MRFFGQLFTSFAYLKAYQETKRRLSIKFWYDFGAPVIMALLSCMSLWFLQNYTTVFGEKGILKDFQGLTQLLVPFYIAALAAVSTFQRAGLDDEIVGGRIYLKEWSNANQCQVPRSLTRRQFVCYIFGYLSTLGITIFLISIFANHTAPFFKLVIPLDYQIFAFILIVFVIFFLIWQMITVTLLGLYFLVEKIPRV